MAEGAFGLDAAGVGGDGGEQAEEGDGEDGGSGEAAMAEEQACEQDDGHEKESHGMGRGKFPQLLEPPEQPGLTAGRVGEMDGPLTLLRGG